MNRGCASKADVDISELNLADPPGEGHSSRLPRSAVVLMLIIAAAMAVLAIYANIQRFRQGRVETVIVTPATSPTAPTH